MKKLCIVLIISIFPIWNISALGQENIQYGSNNGNYLSIFDTDIYYEEYGEGTPLLLLTGGFGSIYYYRLVIPELSKHFKVIAVDSPGHGRSEQADTLSYQLITDYISEMINLMEFDSVYAFGCSDGAIVSMLLAHDRPDKVKRIICDGGVINFEGYYPFVDSMMNSISPKTRNKTWLERISNVPRNDDWEKFIWDMKKMWLEDPYIPDSKMAQIKSRTLIFTGDRDYYIKLEHTLELYRAIQGSELCVLPNLGHCIAHRNPDLMNRIVIDFLTKE